MNDWVLWTAAGVVRRVEGIVPLLAQWERSTHPAQRRLHAYLEELRSRLLPLPDQGNLYLTLSVDVERRERLVRHHDLENYLTPLFGTRCLNASQFVLVQASKRVGGGSSLTIGVAQPESPRLTSCWDHFSHRTAAPATSKQFKEELRSALESSVSKRMAEGPAEVTLAWSCSPARNWVNFWKPTGDAMGAVLGYKDPKRPYNPNDDRIVRLSLHRLDDVQAGEPVTVGMWWRQDSRNGQENS